MAEAKKEDPTEVAAKKTIKEEQDARAKQIAEQAEHQGRPTPTQEENDLVALGVPIPTLSDDGSGPDPRAPKARQSEADKPAGGGYQTRSAPSSPSSSSSSHGGHRG